MQDDKVFVSKHWFWFKFCGVHWQQWIHTNPQHWNNTALFFYYSAVSYQCIRFVSLPARKQTHTHTHTHPIEAHLVTLKPV